MSNKEKRENAVGKKSVGELLRRYPKLLSIFDDYGIHFCAGCFLTLTLPIQKAATYHAVPDVRQLLKDVGRQIKK
ncbi:MAG: hypothetical protein HY401_07025 [Elusimicrobia bacterium]|nr:hypothetical protein [Elusimicrobiota bacterium]